MIRTKRLAVAATALALAIAASGCTTKVVTESGGTAMANTVTASGNGKVAAPPDEATMYFGVTRRDADAKKALAKASTAAEKINAELRKQGITKDDLQTSNVSVYPQYRDSGGKSVIDGFQASIDVTAKVKDLEKLGAIITALTNAGAQNVNGPAFGIGEDAPYRNQAIKKAVDDARSQAEAMADAAGKSVGGVVSISASSVNVPVPMWGQMRGAGLDTAASADVPIEAGQLDVTADVTVVFELK